MLSNIKNFAQVWLDTSAGVLPSYFNFTCSQSSQSTRLLMRKGQVYRKVKGKWEDEWKHTQHKDICKTQRVHVAYYKEEDYFDIDRENNDTMVEYPISWSAEVGVQIFELLSSFYLFHNITPIWHHAKNSSRLENKTGIWRGAVGMVSRSWYISSCHISVYLRLRAIRQTLDFLILSALKKDILLWAAPMPHMKPAKGIGTLKLLIKYFQQPNY